jgi:thiol-disulfide isomerase/thioredoxin
LPPLASLPAVRAAIQAPGARAVLVNVWATWCDSCRDELPAILRFYRENRARGLRLVMVSADDVDQRAEVGRVLDQALAAATLAGPTGVVSLVKQEDDTVFVNGIDRRWSGALPATFLFDGQGERKKSWLAPVTRDELEAGARELLTAGASERKPKSEPKVEARPDRRTP